MRARDLAEPFPTVQLSTPAVEAARLLAGADLPGLIVVGEDGAPLAVLPGTQVLRMAVPTYVQDDPPLAATIDEPTADLFIRALAKRTVRDVLPRERREVAIVRPSATVLEVAALMARTRSPLVAVVESKRLLGAVTLDRLLDRVLAE
jgi:CBS domain-containing protein